MFSQNTVLDTHKTLIYNMISSFHGWQKRAFSKQSLVVVVQTGEVWSERGLQLWGLYFKSTTVFILVKYMSHKEFMHLHPDPLHCLRSIGPLEICHCRLGHCSSQERQMFLEISLLFLNPFALVWDQVHDQMQPASLEYSGAPVRRSKKGGHLLLSLIRRSWLQNYLFAQFVSNLYRFCWSVYWLRYIALT